MAVDEFGREILSERTGRRPDRSPSPSYGSPSRGSAGGGGGVGGTASGDGAPSNLYEALPTSRYGRSSESGGGSSSRKRRYRSESPPHSTRKDASGRERDRERERDERSSSKQKLHPSTLYADDPMLCQYLWKEANPDKSNVDEDYDEYRKGYCLNYIRTFFNDHMDDSWFRAKYSPLDAHRATLQELDRASREAVQIALELDESLAKKEKQQQGSIVAPGIRSTDKCSFIMMARLGGGVKQLRRLPGDDYNSQSPSSSVSPSKPQRGGSTNHVPSTHVLGIVNQVMPIYDVPPHVTNEQLTMALMSHCTSASAAAASRDNMMQVYSSSPAYNSDLTRTAFFYAPDEIRKDIITQLNNLDRGARATTANETTSASHVPRKEETYVPKLLELVVECSDPYGRMEIDADGKGGSPEEEGGVTPRKANVLVSTQPLSSSVQVLSAAVSSRERIKRDSHSALALAMALDQKRNIPSESRLSKLLEKASLPIMTREMAEQDSPVASNEISNGSETSVKVGEGDEEESGLSKPSSENLHGFPPLQDVEDALDVTIAYLRRVHLFSFYNGCSIAPNVGDVLSQNHATSTIHLRLASADDLLRQKKEAAKGFSASAPASTAASTESADAAASNSTLDQPATVKSVDLLEKRLNDSIDLALQQVQPWSSEDTPAPSVVVSIEVDAQARELEQLESEVESRWIQDHAVIDEDGRARCSFHFCRKLFKDLTFLRKHLLKKHPEFLRAERAQCHDSYMMKAWDLEERRPVPPILVNCGRAFGLVPSPVVGGATPTASDPEPELWRREEERRKQEEEEQKMRRERYNNNSSNHNPDPYRNDPTGGLDSALSEPRPNRQDDHHQHNPNKPTRHSGFVDVDDMQEEKVEMAFDNVEVPVVQPPKKKRKKKKLL